MNTIPSPPRELRDEARFYRLQAALLTAFALTEVLPGGAGGTVHLAARAVGVATLLGASFILPILEKVGGSLLRGVVSLSSILCLGELVWIQGRTNGMHALLLVAAGAACLLPRGGAAVAAAFAAAALHGGIVATSGVSASVGMQWVLIETAAVFFALRGVTALGAPVLVPSSAPVRIALDAGSRRSAA